jgi:DNA-directed RNA polymerase specialized sigma24 family protein
MPIYVKNKDLREELIKSKQQGELTKDAIDMFILMSNRFATNFTYIYEEDKEDCIQFAILDCYLYWKGYDPEKSLNAFAYITSIVRNGFFKAWRRLRSCPKSKQISLSSNKIYSI